MKDVFLTSNTSRFINCVREKHSRAVQVSYSGFSDGTLTSTQINTQTDGRRTSTRVLESEVLYSSTSTLSYFLLLLNFLLHHIYRTDIVTRYFDLTNKTSSTYKIKDFL